VVLQDAFETAQRFLDEGIRATHAAHPQTSTVEIVICHCEETDDAWVFGYQSRAFLEQGDINSSLVGNGPLVVPKSGLPPFLDSMF